MKKTKLAIAGFSAVCLFAGPVAAQEEPDASGDPCSGGEMTEGGEGGGEGGEGGGEGGEGGEVAATTDGAADGAAMTGAPPMVLPKGKIGIDVGIAINMSKELVGKPFAILPDIWYGVNGKLEVGVAHSSYGLTGFWGLDSLTGGGLCLAGEENGCAKVYDGPTGVLAHYVVMEGGIDLAADAGLVIGPFDPMTLSAKVGVRGRKMMDKIMIGFAPFIGIGLTERDAGNKEELGIPVDVNYMVNDKIGVGLQTGILGPLDGFGDNFIVPLSVGGMFMVNDKITAGAAFTLHRIAGGTELPDGVGAADFRGLNIFASWHN